jgi:hypothetical protein
MSGGFLFLCFIGKTIDRVGEAFNPYFYSINAAATLYRHR